MGVVQMLYLDESGKSGLFDRSQPWYVLGGLVIREDQWLRIEEELNARIDKLIPPPRAETWELLERFDRYIGRQSDKLGVVVSDEQKEVELATRRAHSKYRRLGTDFQSITHIIETPFFTPSHWSRMLQIVDVVTFYTARHLRGATTGPYWPRIEALLDGYPNYVGKGLKRFP
jgi:hypothetical protein